MSMKHPSPANVWPGRYAGGRRAAILAALLVATAVVLASGARALAAGAPVTRAEYNLFTTAQEHIEHRRFGKAEDLLKGYLERKRKPHAFGYELYGYALLQRDKPEKAAEAMARGMRDYPGNMNIVQNYAAALSRTERYAEAADAYLKAYGLGGETRHGLAFAAAWLLFRDKQYAGAEHVMLDLVKRADARPPWLLLLAQAQLYQNEFGKARALLEDAVERFAGKARLWRLLGFAYFKNGQRDKAAAAYEIAHRLKPPTQREAQQLAVLYASLGAPHLGEAKLADQEATPQMLDALAYGQARAGDLDAALAKASQALADAPTPERFFRKGAILLRMGRRDEAAACFREAGARKNPLQGSAYWTLAMMAWSDGDWAQTSSYLRKAMRADPKLCDRGERMLQLIDSVAATEQVIPHPSPPSR